ncbi:hypothetical protein C8R44DRAFT_769776 [Mycena epipterygia]|nr:hypothetical protein C8R44DRAFT_769776 [Mycena epipterygia]
MTTTPAVDATLGAIEIGMMLALFLFGILSMQVCSYFRKFTHDTWQLKLFVGAIWMAELMHTVLTCILTYAKTVSFFGDFGEVSRINRSLSFSFVVSAAIGPSVQGFYAYRILRLSGHRFIPIICWILCSLQVINTMAVSVTSFNIPTVYEYKDRLGWLITSSLSISASTDVLITSTTCYFLRLQRDIGLRRTQKMIDLLTFWSIQTGLLTTATALLMLILYLTMDNFIWVGVLFLLSRAFSNSLLSTLNSRTEIRESGRPTDFIDIDVGSPRHTQVPERIVIEMSKISEVTMDPGPHRKEV